MILLSDIFKKTMDHIIIFYMQLDIQKEKPCLFPWLLVIRQTKICLIMSKLVR